MTVRHIRTAVVLALLTAATAACSSSTAKPPFTDSRSIGAIALYGKDCKPITHGRVKDKPFVRSAVSVPKAPDAYAVPGRKASLVAVQPRRNADPELWDGTLLTAATGYADPAHPTARADAAGSSLADFLAAYPATWNGYVQLRIYLGAPGRPTLSTSYASAALEVDGDTWSLVGGVPNGVPSGKGVNTCDGT